MWHIESLGSTPSTNADTAARAREGVAEGWVVVADHQQAGRGRLDRVWQTPPGAALTMSVLLRPGVPVSRLPWLPLLTGLAVVEGLDSLGVAADLKWPNDVLLDGRKLAGILAELIDTPQGQAVVVGIGLNVAMNAEQLPVETATSLHVAGHEVDRESVRDAVLAALARRYQEWRAASDEDGVRADYRRRCVTLGRHLAVELPDGSRLSGTGEDVSATGELVVRTESGDLRRIAAGDVVHVRAAE